jgi:hypothetical protein
LYLPVSASRALVTGEDAPLVASDSGFDIATVHPGPAGGRR